LESIDKENPEEAGMKALSILTSANIIASRAKKLIDKEKGDI
jgi:hypothetical protein